MTGEMVSLVNNKGCSSGQPLLFVEIQGVGPQVLFDAGLGLTVIIKPSPFAFNNRIS